MINFLKAIDSQLAILNRKVTAFIGAAIFVPSFTVLVDPTMATAFIHSLPWTKSLPDIWVHILSAQLVGISAYLLYQGKPHNADKAPQ